MNNGLNSIMDLNHKLRKFGEKKHTRAKKPTANRIQSLAIQKNNKSQMVLDPPRVQRQKDVKRSRSGRVRRDLVESENDEVINLSEETFENECNFVEQQLQDMEL